MDKAKYLNYRDRPQYYKRMKYKKQAFQSLFPFPAGGTGNVSLSSPPPDHHLVYTLFCYTKINTCKNFKKKKETSFSTHQMCPKINTLT
jgi:hypothetical protein